MVRKGSTAEKSRERPYSEARFSDSMESIALEVFYPKKGREIQLPPRLKNLFEVEEEQLLFVLLSFVILV